MPGREFSQSTAKQAKRLPAGHRYKGHRGLVIHLHKLLWLFRRELGARNEQPTPDLRFQTDAVRKYSSYGIRCCINRTSACSPERIDRRLLWSTRKDCKSLMGGFPRFPGPQSYGQPGCSHQDLSSATNLSLPRTLCSLT